LLLWRAFACNAKGAASDSPPKTPNCIAPE
jgi:hypothetical protein